MAVEIAEALGKARLQWGLRVHRRNVSAAAFARAISEVRGEPLREDMYRTYERAEHEPPSSVLAAALILAGIDLQKLFPERLSDYVSPPDSK